MLIRLKKKPYLNRFFRLRSLKNAKQATASISIHNTDSVKPLLQALPVLSENIYLS